MGKLLSEGSIKVDGETIFYKLFRDGRLPKGEPVEGYQCYIEAYCDEPIMIMDHGYRLDHALALLRMEIGIRRNKRKA